MYQPPIVNFPVFSVAWVEATDEQGITTPAVLTAGGGGAGNTGVGNKISLIAFKGGAEHPRHFIAYEMETSPQTSNCVAASRNGQLMAGAFGKMVRVYAKNPSGFHKLAEFRGDHAENDSSINSMVFSAPLANGRSVLATGGEDGVLRVWELCAVRNGGDAALLNGAINGDGDRIASLDTTLVSECVGHGKSITCVRFHPSAAVILTASKDGTCRLWDWRRGSQAALLATTSGLPSSVQAPIIMCRACCFAPHKPDAIFTVQSGPRGNAYVTEWKYSIGCKDDDDDRGGSGSVREGTSGGIVGQGSGGAVTCSVEPSMVKCVSPHPATTLSVREDGARLAVGNVEGTVLVYRLPGFAKVMEYRAHDLPVTGLAFAPGDLGTVLGGYDLLAGSADYKITLLTSQGSAAKLAVGQVVGGLWWIIRAILTSVLWLLRVLMSVVLTVIPLLGLLVVGAAVAYYPQNVYDIIAVSLGWESSAGLCDDMERTPVIA